MVPCSFSPATPCSSAATMNMASTCREVDVQHMSSQAGRQAGMGSKATEGGLSPPKLNMASTCSRVGQQRTYHLSWP